MEVGFQYQPVSLDANEVCFEEEQDQDIPLHVKNHEKVKVLLNSVDVGSKA